MRRALLLLLLVPVAARAESPTPLAKRLTEVCGFLIEDPSGIDAIFSPAFLDKVGKDKLLQVAKMTASQAGACTSATVTKPESPLRGEVAFTTAKGLTIPGVMGVEEKAPHLIETLLLRPPVAQVKSLDDAVAKLKALPGTVSLLVQPLDGGAPLAALNEEQPLAVASAYKLYLLAELSRQIAAGKRKASDVVTLKEENRSFSSGYLDKWPKDAPLTLHTVATMMIAKSDNTAADMMLGALGAEVVEAGLVASGHKHPEGMKPFLSTGQMFRLKLLSDDATRARYATAGVADRRKLLATLTRPLSDVKKDPEKPMSIDTIEWFASAGDLCRVMGVLRAQKPMRDVLTVNSGMAIDATRWPFVGFKGGSEMGVLNLTYLLEGKDGKAVCVAATWNDPAKAVDASKLSGLIAAVIQALP